jgi:hypothetical protein
VTELPIAYDGCTCLCHRQEGVFHFMACCGQHSPFPLPATSGIVRDALRKAGEAFRKYERHHLAKISPPDRGYPAYVADVANAEYEAKATRNRELAELMEAALKVVGGGDE